MFLLTVRQPRRPPGREKAIRQHNQNVGGTYSGQASLSSPWALSYVPNNAAMSAWESRLYPSMHPPKDIFDHVPDRGAQSSGAILGEYDQDFSGQEGEFIATVTVEADHPSMRFGNVISSSGDRVDPYGRHPDRRGGAPGSNIHFT